ncbi:MULTISPECIES: hypothetical protein [unclassified Bradyrhizobium]|uniref:hypothetical protein n=1 Tax=unclassified Bradyrhizobium TaxID=2631580 RepID=UPI00247A907F|nr:MULTISPECIES: hypothetical protein [unclassified Bradyrhizobium]WGR72985.1 hypothetical protein MTX24_08960 [Bradyrhizobium sp. ISRA426]WGR77820.1 hypothetical protein MTX21_33915 [Bradyrhizobium sp. ISRA430]WGR88225.1 hypothetical protein MTX25_08965 [Bradyrhizobium sp. ISRA432]
MRDVEAGSSMTPVLFALMPIDGLIMCETHQCVVPSRSFPTSAHLAVARVSAKGRQYKSFTLCPSRAGFLLREA